MSVGTALQQGPSRLQTSGYLWTFFNYFNISLYNKFPLFNSMSYSIILLPVLFYYLVLNFCLILLLVSVLSTLRKELNYHHRSIYVERILWITLTIFNP
jgi:hypothetical protein